MIQPLPQIVVDHTGLKQPVEDFVVLMATGDAGQLR
jgi:hypothetical protein